MASTHLSRTNGTPTNSKKWTISFWMKGKLTNGNFYAIFGCDFDNGDSYFGVGSGGQGRNEIGLIEYHTGGTTYGQGYTNTSLRDSSGWYHIVFAYDSTQSTAADRGKTYINGVFRNSTYDTDIPQNHDSKFNSNGVGIRVGNRSQGGGSANYDGCLSHFHFIDGTAYDATPFGSTDSTTGQWKINTSPSVTYGNNGFFILKDGNSVTDQSGNGNNFSVGAGTLTNTEDCPSHVFCTINPLNSYWAGGTFSNGNTKIEPSSSVNGAWNTGTLGVSSGKYYWEVKVSGSNNGAECQIGIADKSPNGNSSASTAGTSFGYNSNGEYGIYAFNGSFIGNAVANPYTSYGSSGSANDIIMIAIDLDNSKFYGGRNGTWFDSGNPANGTNGKTIQAVANTVEGFYYPAISTYQGYTGTAEFNFGNGYFGTTAVSSAGTNASGIGIFEYDVPTGYTALSTKGLNE